MPNNLIIPISSIIGIKHAFINSYKNNEGETMKPTNPNQAIMTKEGKAMVKKPGCRLIGKGFYFVRTTGKLGTGMISPTSGSKVGAAQS